MESMLVRNWWLIVTRGVLAVLFGVMALFWPGLTLLVLVLFFGAYALLDGVAALIAAFGGEQGRERWWALLIEGVVGIAVGIITLFWPAITELALLAVIAFWAIATGVLEIVAAVRLRREIEGEWLLALAGALSVLFGAFVVITPRAGALALVWLIGGYAIVFGVLLIALGLQLRAWGQTPHGPRLSV
jgi:uncharacterized membrane protein HdeD (DUF308 family)